MDNKKNTNLFFFPSKLVYRGGPAAKPGSMTRKTETKKAPNRITKAEIEASRKAFRKDVTAKKLELSKIANSSDIEEVGLRKMLLKISGTSNEMYFFAAVEWCIKSSSAFYGKRERILGALISNDVFLKSSSVGTILRYNHLFKPRRIKIMLKQTNLNINSSIRGMRRMTKPALTKLAFLMPNRLKRRLVAEGNARVAKYLRKGHKSKISPTKMAGLVKNANSYQKVVNVLKLSLAGKLQQAPATNTTQHPVKTVPYKPIPRKKPTVVQVKHKPKNL